MLSLFCLYEAKCINPEVIRTVTQHFYLFELHFFLHDDLIHSIVHARQALVSLTLVVFVSSACRIVFSVFENDKKKNNKLFVDVHFV